jgi:hypothetical protein
MSEDPPTHHVPGDSDHDLRERFLAERAADERDAPAFARMVAPRRVMTARRRQRARLAFGTVAALIIVVGLWRRPARVPRRGTGMVTLVPGQMRVPTDFLLDIARNTSVRAGEVPSIGALDWYPLDQQERIK